MANNDTRAKKISQLSLAPNPIGANDLFYVVQANTSYSANVLSSIENVIYASITGNLTPNVFANEFGNTLTINVGANFTTLLAMNMFVITAFNGTPAANEGFTLQFTASATNPGIDNSPSNYIYTNSSPLSFANTDPLNNVILICPWWFWSAAAIDPVIFGVGQFFGATIQLSSNNNNSQVSANTLIKIAQF